MASDCSSFRPRRSALYTPASNPRAIAKARQLWCDVVILDLEDAVAPHSKASAREIAVEAVRDGGFGSRELVVRVNALGTPWGDEDLAAIAGLDLTDPSFWSKGLELVREQLAAAREDDASDTDESDDE